MKTLIFYVMTCMNDGSSVLQCNTFEPYSWNVSSEESITLALEECSTLSNAYNTLQAAKETDCYFEESGK